jgi:hypothetical protein
MTEVTCFFDKALILLCVAIPLIPLYLHRASGAVGAYGSAFVACMSGWYAASILLLCATNGAAMRSLFLIIIRLESTVDKN